jgi:hypothetical protein
MRLYNNRTLYRRVYLRWLQVWRVFSYWFIWEYQYKSIAERSYSLLRGRVFTIQISLPRDVPSLRVLIFGSILSRRLIVPHPVSTRAPPGRFELTASMSSKRIMQRLGSLANRLFRLASLMAERLRIYYPPPCSHRPSPLFYSHLPGLPLDTPRSKLGKNEASILGVLTDYLILYRPAIYINYSLTSLPLTII